jgi:hypothetical protein
MSYHTATYRLFNREPRTAVAMEAVLADAERRLGISLPPSVREWYGYEDAVSILAKHSNQDPPVEVRDFAAIERQSRLLLPIRHENQGVCTWAVALNGSEDPPVFVEVDSGGKEWQLLAPSFSAYVYSCVWDYQEVFGKPAIVQAQNVALSRTALDALGRNFTRELETQGWPGNTQHRFTNGTAAVLIWSAVGQADWFVAAPDAATLESILLAVWDIDAVGESFYACSPIGESVLEKIRAMA